MAWFAALAVAVLNVWFFTGDHSIRDVMDLMYRYVMDNPVAAAIYILI